MDEDVGPTEPRGHVGDSPEQVHRNVELAGEPPERRPLWPLAEHDQLRRRVPIADAREGPHGDVHALLRLEPAHREQDVGVGRHGRRRVLPPGLGNGVEPVVDRRHLLARQPDALDEEPGQRLRDRDHAAGSERQRPLDEPERARAERVVVVLGRDEVSRAERAVDVGVDEVRVDEVGVPGGAGDLDGQPRVDVSRCRGPLEGHRQLLVERVGLPRRVVQAEEADVDASLRERRQQREQVPLGAADSTDPVNVQDVHRARHRA
jgi:hypothetical protein